ncbi:hypothetical protein ACFQ1I_31120 [Kitasatospora arboriphila]
METARADNRLGLPLGGAYLRYASGLMQNTMLPSAQQLVTAESGQLDEDFDAAGAMPVAALLLGLAALAALGGYQVLLFRRTNRVFNPGLVAASAAVLAAVLWLAVGGAVASASLTAGRTRGAEPLRVLGQARTEALQARAAENLNLVARGASDSYGKRWQTVTGSLGGAPTPGGGRAGGGTLDRAAALAPAGEAEHRLDEARKQFAQWDSRHDAAAASDRAGDYEAALRATVAVASDTTTEAAWAAMDRQLAAAGAAEQDRFGTETSGVAERVRGARRRGGRAGRPGGGGRGQGHRPPTGRVPVRGRGMTERTRTARGRRAGITAGAAAAAALAVAAGLLGEARPRPEPRRRERPRRPRPRPRWRRPRTAT